MQALQGLDLVVGTGRADRAGRRVRQRQVDADEHPGRARLAHRGRRPGGRARPGVDVGAAAARLPALGGRVHLAADGAQPAALPDRDAERRAAAPAGRGRAAPPAASARPSCSSCSASAHCAGRRPDQMSGGEQQRVAIAVALANSPSVLLADEPTGELDSATAASVFGALQTANSELGVTVLVVTHDPAVSSMVQQDDRDQGRPDRDGDAQARRGRRLGRVGHAVEYAVLDRAGRLQLPREMTEALGMRDRVRLEAEPDHIGVWPDQPDGPAARPIRPSPSPSPSLRTVPREQPSQRRPVGVPVDGRARNHGRRAGRHPHLRQRPDRDRRAARRHLLHRRGKAGRAPRPVRVRQDHPAQRRRRARLARAAAPCTWPART